MWKSCWPSWAPIPNKPMVSVSGRKVTLSSTQQLVIIIIFVASYFLLRFCGQVYMLGMDGPLWECDVILLNCTQLFDLVAELHIPASLGEQPHFKAAHTMNGRLVVTSNTFEEADFVGCVCLVCCTGIVVQNTHTCTLKDKAGMWSKH